MMGCIHLRKAAGFFTISLIAAFILLFPTRVKAWTAAGPWGGVVHDLENQSSGSTTLFAATGNGIYRYGGTLPWDAYPDTLGYRSFEIVADYQRDALYSIVLPVNDSTFSFAELNPAGSLYKITLSSQAFTSMGVSDATSLSVCGTGDLLVGTSSGEVLRFPSGSSAASTSFTSSSEIYALQSRAGSDTVFMSLFNLQSSRGEIYMNSSCGSGTWSLEPPTRSGVKIISLGEGYTGEILSGGDAGQVYHRSSGGWELSAYGTGLPPYPVTGFGSTSNGKSYALLRDHRWFQFSLADGPSGLFEMPLSSSGTWVRRSDFDAVSSWVSDIVSAEGYDWVSFDLSGVRRVISSGSGPGEDGDEGISAASVARIYTDPRSSDRNLAVGSSGIFERRNGQWKRLLLSSVQGAGAGDTLQWIRESGFLSGAISEDDESVIWVGGADTGLLRGEQLSAGAWTYAWTYPYWKDTAGIINDISLDPFDSASLWWVTEKGIYMSTNDGAAWSQVSNSNYDFEDIAVELTDPDIREFLAGHRQQLGEPNILASDRGSVWTTILSTNVMIGALEFLPSSAPGGTLHALAGPVLSDSSAIVIEKPAAGQWQYNPNVVFPPTGLPSNRQFVFISPVLGNDSDGKQDVFAVVRQSAGSGRVFHSEAQTAGGLPGEVWTELTGDLAQKNYSVTSVSVNPKDGNLLWVTTSCASCYTLRGTHSQDSADPAFPTGSSLEGVGSTGSTVDLSWTAPGDDGETPGWADRYEFRFSDNIFTAADSFSSWGTVMTVAAPHMALKNENLSVDYSTISSGANTIAFALRAFDEGNRSSTVQTTSLLSPLSRKPLADVTPSSSTSQVVFTWSMANLLSDPYYNEYGKIVIERDGNEVAEFSGSQKWTDTWSDDIATAGYSPGDLISYVLKAADGAGNSAQVTRVVSIPGGSTGSGGGGGGGGCFIATAAYGSPMAPEIDLLRSYRDGYLVNRWWGRVLLKVYYTLSPVPAEFISGSQALRALSRALIHPIVKLCSGPASSTALPAILGVLLFITALSAFILSIGLILKMIRFVVVKP